MNQENEKNHAKISKPEVTGARSGQSSQLSNSNCQNFLEMFSAWCTANNPSCKAPSDFIVGRNILHGPLIGRINFFSPETYLKERNGVQQTITFWKEKNKTCHDKWQENSRRWVYGCCNWWYWMVKTELEGQRRSYKLWPKCKALFTSSTGLWDFVFIKN